MCAVDNKNMYACVCVCVCVHAQQNVRESQREEVGLKQAHHDIHWNFLQHTRIPQQPSD